VSTFDDLVDHWFERCKGKSGAALKRELREAMQASRSLPPDVTPGRRPLHLGDGETAEFLVARDGPYDVVIGCQVGHGASLLAALTITPHGKQGIALDDQQALLGRGQRVKVDVSGLHRFSWSVGNLHHQATTTRIWISLAGRDGPVRDWPVYELILPAQAGETRSFNIERT
jgi:hypothetical protein